jgi:hypothetical protein
MKKSIFIFFAVLTIYSANAQMGTIPNYLMADNSNFIVVIATNINAGISYVENGGNEFRELNPNDFAGQDEKTFINLSNYIRKKLGAFGLKPADYISINYEKFTADELAKISESAANHSTGYLMSIVITDRGTIDKAIKKNNLDLSSCKMVTVSISKPNESDPSKAFAIYGAGLDLGQAMDKLENEIKKQKSGYFVKSMETPDDNAVFSKEEFDKMLFAKDSVQGFPEESELKKSELLVLCGFKKDGISYKRFNQLLQKKYPFKYRIISTQEYWEECKKETTQYIMLLKGNAFEYTSSGLDYLHNNNNFDPNSRIFIFQYVIKDVKSLKLYLGTCKDCRYSDITSSLRFTLRKMGEFYKWSK